MYYSMVFRRFTDTCHHRCNFIPSKRNSGPFSHQYPIPYHPPPSPKQPLIYVSVDFPVLDFHMNVIIYCVLFFDWLLSL